MSTANHTPSELIDALIKYNFEIIGLLENESLNPNKYFSRWNDKNCINKFHKFTVSKCDDEIILFCEKCQKAKRKNNKRTSSKKNGKKHPKLGCGMVI